MKRIQLCKPCNIIYKYYILKYDFTSSNIIIYTNITPEMIIYHRIYYGFKLYNDNVLFIPLINKKEKNIIV